MVPSSAMRSANLLAALALGVSDRIRQAEEEAAGLGSAAPSAIVALHEFLDGGSLDALRHVVGLTPSGTVRLVDKLVQAGLVERRPGHDMRSRSVVLTRSGHVLARRILDARLAASASVLEGLTVDEKAHITAAVEVLLRQLAAIRIADRARGAVPSGGWLCRLCDLAACGRSAGHCPVATTTP